ncbi:hypothetical protein [Sorangium sp. So ce233]|uniref:hypothetical protein n=1 Tax=Sorangium sp. So ce233 TaxID=3133290 RepID=UPI003F5FF499
METHDQADEAQRAQPLEVMQDEADGFPGVGGILAVRRQSRGQVHGDYKDWNSLEAAIQPDVPKEFLKDVKQAISANMLKVAMKTMWDAVIGDLHRKVELFGLQHLSALPGMPRIEQPADLVHVSSYDLLRGAFQIGLLDEESFVTLDYCRQLTLFQTSKESEPLDRLEFANFIKNCVKYALSVKGMLPPGDDVKKFPPGLLATYVQRASQKLLDAHNGPNNFTNEVRPAEDLAKFQHAIPADVRRNYVKAVTLCFLGNPYGFSYGAAPYLMEMIDRFDVDLVAEFFVLLDSDPDFRSTLMSSRPAERLKQLINRLRSKISEDGDARHLADRYASLSPEQIGTEFAKRRIKELASA